MKKILLVCFLATWASLVWADEEKLGTIEGAPVYTKDLSLKEYTSLYKKSQELYDLKRRYFEQYAFRQLLARLAKDHGLDETEYLRTKIFASIPPISNKEVEDFIRENERQYRKLLHDKETLQRTVRKGLLEERKDEKLEALKAKLFKKEEVLFAGSPIKKPKFDVLIEEDDVKLGPSGAEVDMVVFLDLTCHYCKRVFPVLLDVQRAYADKVRLVFKHFPRSTRGNAFELARKAECAGQQGLFLEYVGKAFNGEKEAQCRDCPGESGEELGVDAEAFQLCMEDDIPVKTVANDAQYGKELGITGVPTIFVNGYPIIGFVDQNELEGIIKAQFKK